MRKFRFRLQTLLSVRRTEERIKKEELAAQRKAESLALERLARLKALQTESLQHEPTAAADLDVRQVLMVDRYRRRVTEAVRNQEQRLDRASEDAEMARQKLVNASQRKAIVEKLKENRNREHRLEERRLEQKSLDEISGRLLRDESGGVVQILLIVIIVYLVLFVGVLKITGILDKQMIPRLMGRPGTGATTDSLAVPDGDLERAALEAGKNRLEAERDSLLTLARRVEMKSKEIDQTVGVLEAIRQENLRAEQKAAQGTPEEEKGFEDLAKVYGSMKAENLSPILAKLDEATLFGVVKNMKSRQVAKFLSALDPARAAQLSVRLTARPEEYEDEE